MKILLLINWKIRYCEQVPDDLQPSDYSCPQEPFWFFKYFDKKPQVDVVDISAPKWIEKVENKYDKKELKDLIEAHVAATGSKLGQKVLDQFDEYLPHFKKLIPNEYKKMITLSAKLEEKGLNSEQAQMEAFYESIGVKH